MAIDREGILARLGLGITEFEAGMNKAMHRAEDFKLRFERLLGNLTMGFAGGAAGFLAADKIKEWLGGIGENAKEILDLSETLTIRPETIQGFQRMTREEWSAGEATDRLNKFSVKLGEALSGDKAAIEALGVGIRDASGNALSGEVVLKSFLDRMEAVGNGAIRANMAQEVFGRGAGKLSDIFAGGSKALGEYAEAWNIASKAELEAINKGRKQWNDWIAEIHNSLLKTAGASAASHIDWKQAFFANMFGFPGAASLVERYLKSTEWEVSVGHFGGPGAGWTKEQKEAVAKLEKEVTEKRRQAASTSDKLLETDKQIADVVEQIQQSEEGAFEQQKAILELEKLTVEKDELRNKLAKEHQQIREREAAVTKQVTELEIQLTNAQDNRARSLADRGGFSLKGLAEATPSNRYGLWQKWGANRAQWLENVLTPQAKLAGREDIAAAATNEALRIRGMLSGLTDAERYPLRSMDYNIVEIKRKLDWYTLERLKQERVTSDSGQ